MTIFGGGTIDGNILPTQTGKDLGSALYRWDAFLQDVDISGTVTGLVASTRNVFTTAPLTGGGDLSADRTIAFSNQSANQVFAGPTTGAAAPAFRALVDADIPAAITRDSEVPASATTQTANTVFSGPTSGGAAAPAFRALVSADVPNNAADTTGKSAKTDALNSATTVVNVASATAPSAGQILQATSSTAATWQSRTIAIPFIIDGAGSAITTGVKGDLEIPFACTLTGATLLADQSGSIVIDIWKDTYANYPPTVADTITAAAKPTLSTATKSQDLTLTGWTTAIAAGNTLRYNVDSITTCTRVLVSLRATIP